LRVGGFGVRGGPGVWWEGLVRGWVGKAGFRGLVGLGGLVGLRVLCLLSCSFAFFSPSLWLSSRDLFRFAPFPPWPFAFTSQPVSPFLLAAFPLGLPPHTFPFTPSLSLATSTRSPPTPTPPHGSPPVVPLRRGAAPAAPLLAHPFRRGPSHGTALPRLSCRPRGAPPSRSATSLPGASPRGALPAAPPRPAPPRLPAASPCLSRRVRSAFLGAFLSSAFTLPSGGRFLPSLPGLALVMAALPRCP
jgi:hypothetical protein